MDNIDAIVFDLDNTLIDTAGADKLAFDKVHHMLHSSYPIFENPRQVIDTFKALLCSGAELNTDAFGEGKSSHDIRLEMWCEAVKRNIPTDSMARHSLDPAKIAAHCNNTWSKTREAGFFISPPTAILLEKIKNSGFKLGILTNGPKDIQQIKVKSVVESLPGGLFDAVVISGEYGIHKPDPRIFEIVCQQLNTKPNRTVMVGDSLDTDILGGNFSGLKTVWFNPNSRECDSVSRQPTCQIQCLNDLAIVIEMSGSK